MKCVAVSRDLPDAALGLARHAFARGLFAATSRGKCEVATLAGILVPPGAGHQYITHAGGRVGPRDTSAGAYDFQYMPEATAVALVEVAADFRADDRAGSRPDEHAHRAIF